MPQLKYITQIIQNQLAVLAVSKMTDTIPKRTKLPQINKFLIFRGTEQILAVLDPSVKN